MKKKIFLFTFLVLKLSLWSAPEIQNNNKWILIEFTSEQLSQFKVIEYSENKRPFKLLNLFKKKKNSKAVAMILAFPFPFGIVGLHRIYLGCSPYVPVVYIASLGGVFGILPFIDFCVLAASKDLESYTNNPKVFMWIKK